MINFKNRLRDTLLNEKNELLKFFKVIKKSKVDIIAMFTTIIILQALVISGINLIKCLSARDFGTYKVDNFITYKNDFEYFSERFYKLYKEASAANKGIESIRFVTFGSEWRLSYTFNDESQNYSECIPMSNKDIESLKRIEEAFAGVHENSFYGVIIVNDNSVEFLGSRGTGVLHKIKGFLPKVNTPKENHSYYYLDVFACPGWYHVMEKLQF